MYVFFFFGGGGEGGSYITEILADMNNDILLMLQFDSMTNYM